MGSKLKEIILIGGGGHCKVIIDAIVNAGEHRIKGIVDSKLEVGTSVLGVPVLGDDEVLPMLFENGTKEAFISVGSIGDCKLRRKIFEKIKDIGFNMPVVIHPRAVVAKDVIIGAGTFVAASATINPGTVIGQNAIINTSCSIDHDCIIGDFVHVAPGATLSGGVKIGEGSHIGTGANIIQGTRLADNSFVKAGQLVIRDIGEV